MEKCVDDFEAFALVDALCGAGIVANKLVEGRHFVVKVRRCRQRRAAIDLPADLYNHRRTFLPLTERFSMADV